MTDKQYVIRACQLRGVDLFQPTRKAPGILGMKDNQYVIDCAKWSEAREQINKFFAGK